MPEAAATAFGGVYSICLFPFDMLNLVDHHLGNPVSRLYHMRLVGQVDEDHLQFAPVV